MSKLHEYTLLTIRLCLTSQIITLFCIKDSFAFVNKGTSAAPKVGDWPSLRIMTRSECDQRLPTSLGHIAVLDLVSQVRDVVLMNVLYIWIWGTPGGRDFGMGGI
jgi:hypothetical protein